MLDDMTSLYGIFGNGNGSFSDDDDQFLFQDLFFYNGIEWYKVGLRFKGNSSLARFGVMEF